jgi:hypothetical protein
LFGTSSPPSAFVIRPGLGVVQVRLRPRMMTRLRRLQARVFTLAPALVLLINPFVVLLLSILV